MAVKISSKILALTAIFGAIAVMLSFINIPFPPFGDVTPASTPVSVISTAAPSIVGIGASLIKGVGISMWTGNWFMEIPVGIGDAFMAAFTYYLAKKWFRRTYSVTLGQLSRFLFTSGAVALYVGIIISTGIPSPLGGDVVAKFNSYAGKLGIAATSQSFLYSVAIVWLARFPSMALSILLNAILSILVVRSLQDQLNKLASYLNEKT